MISGLLLAGVLAAPTPAPAPSGVPVVARAWACETTAASVMTPAASSCAVTDWQPLPTPLATQPVAVTTLPPVTVTAVTPLPVSVPSPLPVREVASPQPVGTVSLPPEVTANVDRLANDVPAAAALLIFVGAVAVPLALRFG